MDELTIHGDELMSQVSKSISHRRADDPRSGVYFPQTSLITIGEPTDQVRESISHGRADNL